LRPQATPTHYLSLIDLSLIDELATRDDELATSAAGLSRSKGRMKNRGHSLELTRDGASLFFARC
jgi:hypothetical protein